MKLISAREAFKKGLTRYFTGKKCSYGHLDERMISNGSCVSCLNEKRKRSHQDIYEATKVWRLKNPEARRIEAGKYRKKHPDKVASNAKAYRQRNIEEVRKRDRENAKRMRAINPEKEKSRLKRFSLKREQKRIEEAGRNKPDLCEICSTNEFKIVFDHCHNSNRFRGWICDRCNRVLGIVKDNSKLLNDLALYLEKFNVKVEC
jgi:hypothetical protein